MFRKVFFVAFAFIFLFSTAASATSNSLHNYADTWYLDQSSESPQNFIFAGNLRPKVEENIPITVRLRNGDNYMSAGNLKVYFIPGSTGNFQSGSNAGCINWDVSQGTLLKTVLISALPAHGLYSNDFSVSLAGVPGVTLNAPWKNNLVFKYSDSVGLSCAQRNFLLEVDDNTSDFPDLAIKNISVSPANPSINDNITIQYSIKNEGDVSTTEPIRACLHRRNIFNNTANAGLGSDMGTPSANCGNYETPLAPGQSATFTMSVDVDTAYMNSLLDNKNAKMAVGQNRMAIEVNSSLTQVESNYSNNEEIFYINIANVSDVPNETNLSENKEVGLTDGDVIKSPIHPVVYRYEKGTRRSFPNSQIYHTWYSNFNNVKVITPTDMESIKLGYPMAPKAGAGLIKFPYNSKVYEVLSDNVIKHIPNEQAAIKAYGTNWVSKITTLSEIYFLFYTVQN